MTADELKEKLRSIPYPGFSRDIVSFGVVKDIRLREDATEVDLQVVTENDEVRSEIVAAVQKLLASIDGLPPVELRVEQPQRSGMQQAKQMASAMGHGPSKPPGVAHVIAVASGKGGVGKSTVAANLAVALAQSGCRVGLLDTDIYGPSVPTLFGLSGEKQRTSEEDGRLLPLERYGVKLVSMGFFVGEGAPLIWRGPMLGKALGQFLNDVEWGELDYLILDLPPGTGDVQMTLTQSVDLDGGLIVTTPQDVALADVERGVKMFQQVDTPVLGVVENMSFHICPGCGRRSSIFGDGGGKRIAESFKVPFLGEIPLTRALREAGDRGQPVTANDEGGELADAFAQLAGRLRTAVPVEELGHA